MSKLINKKNNSQYQVLKESQTLCSVPSNWQKPRSKYDVKDANVEFEFPENLDTLKDKEETTHG